MIDFDKNSHEYGFINGNIQQQLQQLLTDLQLDDAPAGGAVVVYQNDNCIAQASIGMAQVDMPWQPETLSLNFSTGKGVLATLVHVLVSQQLLDYDTPIASYWSEFAANGKAKVTLRAVLSHQADLFAINTIDLDGDILLNWQAMRAKVAAMPMSTPDASDKYESAYSALVYGWIIGGLIEVVTNMTLADALRYYLTEPLGIDDSCYFGVPDNKIDEVAKLTKDFKTLPKDSRLVFNKRHKPLLKPDSQQTLATYEKLPSYQCWQRLAADSTSNNSAAHLADEQLTSIHINTLYFDHNAINISNYKASLIPANKTPIDYHDSQTLQAVIPAANGVASAQALARVYALLANGGRWQGQTLINEVAFAQLVTPQVSGQDAVMPASMQWRLGYHRLFSVCTNTDTGFGHMGYNGSVAWCDPVRQLSFAFVHNFDVTMLNDVRQFALTEALLALMDDTL